LTGLSVPESHRFYKRATKKNLTPEQDGLLAKEFHDLCQSRAVPAEAIAEQWVLLTHFRRYTFCKSHAVSYGLLAWQCVAAKAHRPLQFWAAVLNNNQGVYPRRVYVEASKRAGFGMLLPCINRSGETFTPEGHSVRTGLGAIATLSEEVRARILAERGRGGPYGGLPDFLRRVAPGPEALAALIRCGALDFTGRNRPALFLEAELQGGAGEQAGLYPDAEDLSWTPNDYDLARRRADEQRFLGFVADVPMMSLFRPLLPPNTIRSVDLPRHKGRRVRVAGLVATGRFAYTEKGLEVQFITLEDEWGLMEATIFPWTCRMVRRLTTGPYLVDGLVDEQFGVFGLTAKAFTPVAQPAVQKALGDRIWPASLG
jgi:DNA polymerase III alpha subunit